MFPAFGRPARAPTVGLARRAAAATTVVHQEDLGEFLPAEAHAAEDPPRPGPQEAARPRRPLRRPRRRPAPALHRRGGAQGGPGRLTARRPLRPAPAVEDTTRSAAKPPEARRSRHPRLPRPPLAGGGLPSPPPAVRRPQPANGSPPPSRPAAAARGYPFSLLLASCQDRRNAEAALTSYRRLGLAPYIVQTDSARRGCGGGHWPAHYPSTTRRGRQAGACTRQAVVVKTPYANLVGEYASEAEATDAAAALARKGLFPYLLKGSATVPTDGRRIPRPGRGRRLPARTGGARHPGTHRSAVTTSHEPLSRSPRRTARTPPGAPRAGFCADPPLAGPFRAMFPAPAVGLTLPPHTLMFPRIDS